MNTAINKIRIENETYVLEDMSGDALAGIYAGMAQDTGDKPVTRFPDKVTAVRRVLEMHEKWKAHNKGEVTEAKKKEVRSSSKKTVSSVKKTERTSAKAKKEKADRKVRQKYFHFPVEKVLRKVRENTLRAKMIELLRGGATYEQCVRLTEKWDTKRQEAEGKKVEKFTLENVDRRAYECIRLLHYYIGYGLRQDEAGKIFLVEPKA